MRALSAVIVVVMLSGCLPFHMPFRIGRSSLLARADSVPRPTLDHKAVVLKEAPTSLIAADGSRCLVSTKKYSETPIGDRVWCIWSGKDGRKTAYSFNGHGQPSGRHREIIRP